MAGGAPVSRYRGFRVHELDEAAQAVARRLRENAVPQVEDVPRASTGAREHGARLARADVERPDERSGLQVALDAEVRADPRPGLVERDPPVHADDIAPRARHRLEQVRGVRAEMDGGRVAVAQGPKDPCAVWQHMGLVCIAT